MKRRLVLPAALAAVALVPLAAAAPATTHTLQGTVIAKDRARLALVVARPGGAVQMVVAPKALARTAVGRMVVIRYAGPASRLPVALTVSPGRRVRHAAVRGIIVRLAQRRVLIEAGGILVGVTLTATPQRTLSSTRPGAQVGDRVKVELEIRADGSLVGANVTQVATPAGEGELEVRGTVSALVPATATLAGSVTVTVRSLPVTCAIPPGTVLTVEVGGFAELECRLVGDPAVWTVRAAKAEDVQEDDDVDEVEVRGTIASPFAQTASIVTVMPLEGGVPVSCSIPPGSLSQFAAVDAVKVECVTSAAF